jgi:hypothetical protein
VGQVVTGEASSKQLDPGKGPNLSDVAQHLGVRVVTPKHGASSVPRLAEERSRVTRQAKSPFEGAHTGEQTAHR